MRLILLPVLVTLLMSQAYSAPQFITFTDGKLGVNFGGYHAAVGIGGGGSKGGLYAEAGTPHGPAAIAGLGGALDSKGGPMGGLFAGATAGGNVKASAGLGGAVVGEKSVGGGYAAAQAGNRFGAAGLGGESGVRGSSGFSYSSSNSHPSVVVKEIVQPVDVLEVKPVHKKVHTKFIAKTEVDNEVSNDWTPLGLFRNNYEPLTFQGFLSSMFRAPHRDYNGRTWFNSQDNVEQNYQAYVPPPPAPVATKVIEKHIVHSHYKPHRHHLHNKAFIGGYLESSAGAQPVSSVKTFQSGPVLEKRLGVEAEAGSVGEVDVGGSNQVGYTKQVTFQRNPTFFADIFNIPISTLKAVGNFLGNTAGSTNVSVQKTASVQKGVYA